MTRLQDVPGRNQDLTSLLEDLFEAGMVHLDEPDTHSALRGVSRNKRFRQFLNGKVKRMRGTFAGNKAWRQHDDDSCEWNNNHRNRQKERELRSLDEEDIAGANIIVFGKTDAPLVKPIGSRWFISPGLVGASGSGLAVIDDEKDDIEVSLFDGAGKLTARHVLTVQRAAKMRVQEG